MIRWATYLPTPHIVSARHRHRKLKGSPVLFEKWARSHIGYCMVAAPTYAVIIPIYLLCRSMEIARDVTRSIGRFLAEPMRALERRRISATEAYNSDAGVGRVVSTYSSGEKNHG